MIEHVTMGGKHIIARKYNDHWRPTTMGDYLLTPDKFDYPYVLTLRAPHKQRWKMLFYTPLGSYSTRFRDALLIPHDDPVLGLSRSPHSPSPMPINARVMMEILRWRDTIR